MKSFAVIGGLALLALALSCCEHMEAITELGTDFVAGTTGIEREKAEAVTESATLVAKSFQDITPEQEYYIGRAVGAVILNRYKPYPDQKANEYLNLLGQTLALSSNRPETFGGYHFLILDSDEINAFATPSGLIFVTRGILRCATSEDTVAAILAHEIGHVEHRHGLQAIKKSRITKALTSVALTSAQVAGPKELAELTSLFEDSIMDITTTMINKGYSRAFEKDADKAAVQTLRRTGYDPQALIAMLKVMDQRMKPGGLDFAKTHPDPEDRVRLIEEELGGTQPAPAPSAERKKRYGQALSGI